MAASTLRISAEAPAARLSVHPFRLSFHQTPDGGELMRDEPKSWTLRRAAQLAALPRAPRRSFERPSHAQFVALPDDHPQSHRWVVNAAIPVSSTVARNADFRGTFRASMELKIDVLDVLCSACGKPFGDVAGEPCGASQDRSSGMKDHLLSGRPHERARRTTSRESDKVLIRERERRAERRAANREQRL